MSVAAEVEAVQDLSPTTKLVTLVTATPFAFLAGQWCVPSRRWPRCTLTKQDRLHDSRRARCWRVFHLLSTTADAG